MVHYRFIDSGITTCLAAIMTAIPHDRSQPVALHVFTPPGQLFPDDCISIGEVPHSIQGEESTWHWPRECYG
jgi:hypothetical protein